MLHRCNDNNILICQCHTDLRRSPRVQVYFFYLLCHQCLFVLVHCPCVRYINVSINIWIFQCHTLTNLSRCKCTSSICFFISVCLFLCMPSVRYIAPGQINLYSWISLPAGQLRKINFNQFSPFCSVSFFISRKIEKFTFHRTQVSLFRSIGMGVSNWLRKYILINLLIDWLIEWLIEWTTWLNSGWWRQ